jgi:hypothetical protein
VPAASPRWTRSGRCRLDRMDRRAGAWHQPTGDGSRSGHRCEGGRACLTPVTSIRVPTVAEEDARDLVRARDQARSDLMRARNRLSKLLLRHGIVSLRRPDDRGMFTKAPIKNDLRPARVDDRATRAGDQGTDCPWRCPAAAVRRAGHGRDHPPGPRGDRTRWAGHRPQVAGKWPVYCLVHC